MKKKLLAAIGLAVFASATFVSAGPDQFHAKLGKDREILHALSRLTFGARDGDAAEVRKIGLKPWIERQLQPESIPESPVLEAKLAPLASLTMTNQQLAESYPPRQAIAAFADGRMALPTDPQKRAAMEQLVALYKARRENKGAEVAPQARAKGPEKIAPQQTVARELAEGKLYRAIYSDRQLSEVLTDFWYNHFNVFLNKGADRFLVTAFERDAIRPFVLGNFRQLLEATAKDPAMLFYLDNWRSVTPKAVGREGRQRGLNENYARELLELHTLGVDGGYTQKDIQEVARCFTGWTIQTPYGGAGFQFNARVHDKGEKTVLGVKIPAGGGMDDGLKVLDIVAHHRSTAHHIATQLAQRFVADNPPVELIDAMAKTFQQKDGDLREVMRTMLASKEFWSEGAYRAKVKSPLEMVASAIRATGADVKTAIGLAKNLADLGQPLYMKQEPTGYSNSSDEWVNSAALLGRMNFALALTQNKLRGVKVDAGKFEGDPTAVAESLLSGNVSAQTRLAIEKGQEAKQDSVAIAGLILGSPDFQRR